MSVPSADREADASPRSTSLSGRRRARGDLARFRHRPAAPRARR